MKHEVKAYEDTKAVELWLTPQTECETALVILLARRIEKTKGKVVAVFRNSRIEIIFE